MYSRLVSRIWQDPNWGRRLPFPANQIRVARTIVNQWDRAVHELVWKRALTNSGTCKHMQMVELTSYILYREIYRFYVTE